MTLYNYQKGGKEGNPPDMGILFFETRKKDGKLVEPETEEKHVCSTTYAFIKCAK